MKERGVILEALRNEVNKDMDDFDLICHLAFDQKPLTRQERANKVKKRDYFGKYSEVAREVIDALLEKYMNEGITELENIEILKLDPFKKIGSPVKIMKAFGGKKGYINTVREISRQLYA